MMNRKIIEQCIVVVLFVVVFVVFTLAERDSRNLKQLYTKASKANQKIASVQPK